MKNCFTLWSLKGIENILSRHLLTIAEFCKMFRLPTISFMFFEWFLLKLKGSYFNLGQLQQTNPTDTREHQCKQLNLDPVKVSKEKIARKLYNHKLYLEFVNFNCCQVRLCFQRGVCLPTPNCIEGFQRGMVVYWVNYLWLLLNTSVYDHQERKLDRCILNRWKKLLC